MILPSTMKASFTACARRPILIRKKTSAQLWVMGALGVMLAYQVLTSAYLIARWASTSTWTATVKTVTQNVKPALALRHVVYAMIQTA